MSRKRSSKRNRRPVALKSAVPSASSASASEHSGVRNVKWSRWFPLGIILGVVIAYHNSLTGPFVFDDIQAVVENASIRDLSDIRAILSPPLTATGAVGRPMVNLSFAVNYALSGESVRGYHVTNLFIHLACALLVFGVLRRTFNRLKISYWQDHANALAAGVALLWGIHPLLTESVTAVVQRNESLMGLFLLGTIYTFLLSLESPYRRGWQGIAIVSCLLGMATKEVMAVCPVLLLGYDRIFVAGQFSTIWRDRKWLYGALFAAWGLLLFLIMGSDSRNQTVGFQTGISWWQYLQTQCVGIPRYLGLSFWPSNLVFDYGTQVITAPARVVPGALLLTALLGTTIWALVKKPVIGFWGMWFILILGPSSSIYPLATQTLAEHRMYLPLIGIVVIAMMGLVRLLGERWWLPVLCVAPILIWGTVGRNNDYQSAITLWADTVEKVPDNARAHNGLGTAFSAKGDEDQALLHFQKAVQLEPNNASFQYNLGSSLLLLGRAEEALTPLHTAIQLRPTHAKAYNDLGKVFISIKQYEQAKEQFERAAEFDAQNSMVWMNLANTYVVLKLNTKAIDAYQRVLALDPHHSDAANNLRYLGAHP